MRTQSSDVSGCAGCILTITGQPAANAETVSVPSAPNARGKLLASKFATGPTPLNVRKIDALPTEPSDAVID